MKNQYNVVVTGIGLVTPLGATRDMTWRRASEGSSGLVAPSKDQQALYPCPAMGVVRGEGEMLDELLDKKHQAKTDRFTHFSLLAADEALKDAGLRDDVGWDRDECGVYVGVGLGGLDTLCSTALYARDHGYHRVSPFVIPRVISNQAAGIVSQKYGLHGPLAAVTTACSSGGDAIGLAFRLVRDGYIRKMIAGGSEHCLTTLALAAFGNMRAMSSWKGDPAGASRPFDAHRSGFVMGEGAGILILEREDDARARGARPYGRCLGYGAASDGYHSAAMREDGLGAELAIRRALHDGDCDPSMVDYINAHGTGTVMNDAIEAAVIKKIFPHAEHATNRPQLLISSTKSMMGHLLGAAGAVEAALTLMMLRYGLVLPTINRDTVDPACDLDVIPHSARAVACQVALSNAFGFGGACSSLMFSRYEEKG